MDTTQFLQELNDEFAVMEVGESTAPTEDAFPQKLPVPQFLNPEGPNRWSPKLVGDLALGVEPIESILENHDLTKEQLDALYTVPSFRHEVALLAREYRENGVTFGSKCAAQAEMYLEDIHYVMHSPDTPASTRLEIFKYLTKLGKLEPKDDSNDNNGGAQVNVQIVLS